MYIYLSVYISIWLPFCLYIHSIYSSLNIHPIAYQSIVIYTVLSVNEYTPFEKYNFKQYLNEYKNHFQNVDKTKFNITSV